MGYRKHFVPAVVMGLILATGCFAKDSSESYSELLRKALYKAQWLYHGSDFTLLRHIRHAGFEDSKWIKDPPEFIPLVEGLDEPNAVPFLVKVVYEGPNWDKELPRSRLIGYENAGRCYSVLSLAVSGDPVAFAVLSDILENDANFTDPCIPEIIKEKYGIRAYVTDAYPGERDKRRHDIRAYAAAGLGMLGDSNAVEPLLRMLGDKNSRVKHQCLWALGRIGDVRTIKPMLEAALHDEQIDWLVVHVCMLKMTKTKFDIKYSRKSRETTVKEFPELGNFGRGAHIYKKVWGHWLKTGKEWTEREFEKRYERWREIKHKNYRQAMERLGIAALPLMIEKIREGETALIPLVSRLVDRELAEDASRRQCLRWWQENRDKWVITFEDAPIALPTDEELSRQSDVAAYVDKLTGFGELEGISKSFERVDINDDNTPFLHRQINGKKGVWRVEIKNVRLKLKSAIPGAKDRYVRTFEVFIDPNTGHLLKVTSTFDGNDPDMLPEPSAASAEGQMRRHGNETYHGFPPTPPQLSLLDALDAVGSSGIGSPFRAKEIHAVYVMESRMRGYKSGWEPRPVWAITLRGLPPRPVKGIPPSLRHIPEEELVPTRRRNQMRNVVDDVTGRVLFATSTPKR